MGEIALSEASIIQLSVVGRHLGIDVDRIVERHYDEMAKDLLAEITGKIRELNRLPPEVMEYCGRRGINIYQNV